MEKHSKNLTLLRTTKELVRVIMVKNTGGMGAYCPSGLINEELDAKIVEKIIKPTFKAINDMGAVYKGFLYVGLMIKK